MFEASIILSRVVLGTAATTLQKGLLQNGTDGPRLWRLTYLWMLPVVLCVPKWSALASLGSAFWQAAILAGVLDALGNVAMARALQQTDLSVFGPLNGLRPLLAVLFGWCFLGETVSMQGGSGILITVTGAVVLLWDDGDAVGRLVESRQTRQLARRRIGSTLGWRVLGLGLSTFASVYLKRAVTAGDGPTTLAVWILAGLPVVWLSPRLGFRQSPERHPDAHFPPLPGSTRFEWQLGLHALLFLLMQYTTLLVFKATPLGYSFAFFQLGMVLQVLLGIWWFKEGRIVRRLSGCLLMSGGAMLIVLARR